MFTGSAEGFDLFPGIGDITDLIFSPPLIGSSVNNPDIGNLNYDLFYVELEQENLPGACLFNALGAVRNPNPSVDTVEECLEDCAAKESNSRCLGVQFSGSDDPGEFENVCLFSIGSLTESDVTAIACFKRNITDDDPALATEDDEFIEVGLGECRDDDGNILIEAIDPTDDLKVGSKDECDEACLTGDPRIFPAGFDFEGQTCLGYEFASIGSIFGACEFIFSATPNTSAPTSCFSKNLVIQAIDTTNKIQFLTR
ncbi:unnamed protein product [Vitrella brassicaformis CCMP3155]|uniref:Uncharacterized protein n=1 Tax=Vitrella brassicaformis (strain CCMP3155) TaxID=1169540 RepID=A0A0G4EFN5_VITBC|nr:unnamed protein product [Vitrella brassicaformis CCMP3155]|eukprot:CEL94547.1 unnamed protein product [Vitrella brassicaformis CCMP3155]